MLILTHEGPGYRSRLISRGTALAKASELQGNPEFTGVKVLESTRARHPTSRFFIVALPVCPEHQVHLLGQLQHERNDRAEQEGPAYLWAPDPDRPFWHLVSTTGQVYEVDNHGQTCTCRDFGVCRDNGLVCKHLVAFEKGFGTFLSPEHWGRLRLLAVELQSPRVQRERRPVALPVAA